MALDLNEKPWWVPLLIGIVLGGAMFFGAHTQWPNFKKMLRDIQTLHENIAQLEREIEKGRQVFVICPLVEESEKVEARCRGVAHDTTREEVA